MAYISFQINQQKAEPAEIIAYEIRRLLANDEMVLTNIALIKSTFNTQDENWQTV